jgi:hypothetical protein
MNHVFRFCGKMRTSWGKGLKEVGSNLIRQHFFTQHGRKAHRPESHASPLQELPTIQDRAPGRSPIIDVLVVEPLRYTIGIHRR